MGFSTPPGHRNPTYDTNTDGAIDSLEDGASFRNAEYDTDTDGKAEELDEDRLQETAIAVQFVMGGSI